MKWMKFSFSPITESEIVLENNCGVFLVSQIERFLDETLDSKEFIMPNMELTENKTYRSQQDGNLIIRIRTGKISYEKIPKLQDQLKKNDYLRSDY